MAVKSSLLLRNVLALFWLNTMGVVDLLSIQCPISKHVLNALECSSVTTSLSFSEILGGVLWEDPAFVSTGLSYWTHTPVCIDFVPELGSPLCVFTNASFGADRGISFVTTPGIASGFAGSPPAGIDYNDRGRVLSSPSSLWQAKPLPGKGIGVIAATTIESGTLLMAHQPVLVVHTALDNIVDREDIIQLAIDQLPPSTRAAILNLSRMNEDPAAVCRDILKSNAFQIPLGSAAEPHFAIFPETSRLNHDCGPNAIYYFDPLKFTHYVRTTRPIKEHEEITISYTSPLANHEARQQHLSSFGFECACRRCTNQHSADITFHRIHELLQLVADWGTHDTKSESAIELIDLFKAEGLEGWLDLPYGHAALLYNADGDEANAKRYAELAQEVSGVRLGVQSREYRFWKSLCEAPREHWSWTKRGAVTKDKVLGSVDDRMGVA